MSARICRWGILGAASIARKNWQAIRNAGNATLHAVASRDATRAEAFIRECQSHTPFDPPPRAVGGYEALLADGSVDAVYIPLPTALRKEWVVKAARAGKHVLAEKPAGVDAAEVKEMLDACAQGGVQFMDGVMFMHSKRLDKLREVIDGESVGTIRRIASQFSFFGPEDWVQRDIRLHGELEPAGCLGDLGWYNLRFTLWVMGYALPRQVSGRLLAEAKRPDSPRAVPTEFSGELFFDGGVSASFYCSFRTEHQQWAHVSGTKGSVSVPDFVLPYYGAEATFTVSRPVFNVHGCDFNMAEHTARVAVAEYSNSAPDSQEANMIRTFSGLALGGKPDPTWGEVALKTQRVLDACLASAREGGRVVEVRG
jgi:predicted dehydrogenase